MNKELYKDPVFLDAMDNMMPKHGWRRAGDNPTEILHMYTEAVDKDPELASVLKMKYLRVTEMDAKHFGIEPLELFNQHMKGLEEEYASFDVQN